MKAKTINELVMALKCSCSVRKEGDSCVDCPYRGLEEIDKTIPHLADVVIDGIECWEYCDTEAMALDAAEVLEKFMGE